MKITSLAENTAFDKRFEAEHGLSLYIETERCQILFDMGQSDLFERNAEKCGIDLSKVDFAVLSHGHYDHGGGLKRFLALNQTAPIYLSRFAFEPHYNGSEKYIGLDISLKEEKRLIFTGDSYQIAPGITLLSCNDRSKRVDLGSFGLNMMENDILKPDDFRHEQYLLIEENGKKILFSGCSHKGILNIVQWFSPDVLIGGFHFSKLPLDDTLKSYAEELNRYHTDFYTCHCTGCEQYRLMQQHMKRLSYLSAGQTIII
ncbi:MAG: MBL fold metallo-hydrolase [Ruminococcus sp.]|nr:MBL fold metallo-hydrolase [Ruminococcus sp.]